MKRTTTATAVEAAGVALVVKGALETAGQEAGRSGDARLIERIRARFRGSADAGGALDRVTGPARPPHCSPCIREAGIAMDSEQTREGYEARNGPYRYEIQGS
ncbi:hypothetical protein [Streptomyces canus]|uniref:hypothetical protein n=1 Tax=Streptomyces canus TaxID=58343 RepID=UPI00386E31C8|nr:hypothetical protein OH824_07035 [Streptomyces canus]